MTNLKPRHRKPFAAFASRSRSPVNAWRVTKDGLPDAPWRAVRLAPLFYGRRLEFQAKFCSWVISAAKGARLEQDPDTGLCPPPRFYIVRL